MKVENFTNAKGNKVKNQFIITDGNVREFQSYDSVIVSIENFDTGARNIYLDETYWDYSVTTGKYRNQFLGETKKETEKKIKNGEYTLTNLN